MKTCTKCGETKALFRFYTSQRSPDGRLAECKECFKKRATLRYELNRAHCLKVAKVYREANREKIINGHREYYHHNKGRHRINGYVYHQKLRDDVIEGYGGSCDCCGETNRIFLTLDHVNNDGAAHKKTLGSGRGNIYRYARRNHYPNDLRLLCWNCNSGRSVNGGICPHEQERQSFMDLTAAVRAA